MGVRPTQQSNTIKISCSSDTYNIQYNQAAKYSLSPIGGTTYFCIYSRYSKVDRYSESQHKHCWELCVSHDNLEFEIQWMGFL